MNYNDWAKEIHENAVKHGWYDKPISRAEYEALFHSEISEALEEYRNEMPDVYWNCGVTGEICAPASECDCEYCDAEWECTHRDQEPHGIAIELIDLAIRLLDYGAAHEIDIPQCTKYSYSKGWFSKDTLILTIAGFHEHITLLMGLAEYQEQVEHISTILFKIQSYCEDNGLDFETLLHLKHEYNKTRPYRHGGKRC